MTKQNSKSLLMIVGMHRSGTSVVGRLLDNMGFEFGNNLLEGIRTVNDDGFWEDKEVISLNEHIFELYDFRWFDFERMPGKWWEDAKIKNLTGIAETWYYESFSGERPIAVKDPRFCRLLPFWKRVFQGLSLELNVLFVFRHPVEVAASLKKRDGFPMPLGFLLWLSYTIDALYYSRNLNLSLLHYKELLETPRSVVDRLCDKNLSRIVTFSDVERSILVEKSIDTTRHHQKSETLLNKSLSKGDIEGLAMELYEDLLAASADMAKGLADKYRKRLYRLLDHHEETLSALQEETHNQVRNVQKLFKLGDDHAHALAVINEKDIQLEENKNFIQNCLNEIQNKEILLKSKENILPQTETGAVIESYAQRFDGWMADLNRLVDDYKTRIEEQKIYIEECEAKLASQENGLADNQDYIAKCHSRIAEQDVGIAENRGYITACEERIRVQDEGLGIRDRQLSEKDEQILNLEKTVAQLKERIGLVQAELLEKDQQLQIQTLSLQENAIYIAECQARISEQDMGISENKGYIVACEERIRVQDEGIGIRDRQLSEKDEKIISLERNLAKIQEQMSIMQAELIHKDQLVQKQTLSLQENVAYIAECQARISEQDMGISENKGYILACEDRIRVQDETITEMNGRIEEKSLTIIELDRSILQLRDQSSVLDGQVKKLSLKQLQSDQAIAELSEKLQDRDSIIKTEQEQNKLLAEELQKSAAELSNKALTIDRLEGLEAINRQRIALQKIQIEKIKAHSAALESELIALRSEHDECRHQLERYRSYRMVRAIDKLFPET